MQKPSLLGSLEAGWQHSMVITLGWFRAENADATLPPALCRHTQTHAHRVLSLFALLMSLCSIPFSSLFLSPGSVTNPCWTFYPPTKSRLIYYTPSSFWTVPSKCVMGLRAVQRGFKDKGRKHPQAVAYSERLCYSTSTSTIIMHSHGRWCRRNDWLELIFS